MLNAMAENRTRVNCLEGNYANHYTTIASCSIYPSFFSTCTSGNVQNIALLSWGIRRYFKIKTVRIQMD